MILYVIMLWTAFLFNGILVVLCVVVKPLAELKSTPLVAWLGNSTFSCDFLPHRNNISLIALVDASFGAVCGVQCFLNYLNYGQWMTDAGCKMQVAQVVFFFTWTVRMHLFAEELFIVFFVHHIYDGSCFMLGLQFGSDFVLKLHCCKG